jgi:flavin-dependent dehydrogenase
MHASQGRGHDHDVIVIGGGPGGAAVATRLARRGRRVLVLEREAFPRFHIGESQLPWSRELWHELGLDEALARAGFVDKWGATFITANGAIEQYADFNDAAETPQPQTYQVPRAEFDRIFLQHAAASGAEVRQPAQAVDVTFESDGVTVRFLADGTQHETRAAAIVDASGKAGFVARRRSERQFDPQLRNVALHAQYEEVPRPSGRRAGDIRMVMRPDRGWFWFIPLSASVTSVGIVLPKEAHARSAGATLEQALAAYLAETPTAAALTAHARRVTPVRFDADYSYCARRFAGDRWLLVGDAGAFLDPIFSTGVLMAMQSGVDAADALDAALTAGDLSERRFAGYERATRARWTHFRRFAVGFYDPAFRDLFFRPRAPFRMREALTSVLAGNWRPRLATRIRIALFFAAVAVQRRIAIAPRLGDLDAAAAAPSVRAASHAA